MKNIGVYIYDYSLMGGAQEVTLHLVNLFYRAGLPIKQVFTHMDSGIVKRDYPKGVEITNIEGNCNVMIERIHSRNIGNLIMQVENLQLTYKMYSHIRKCTNCNVVFVLHNTPYYWLRKYYSFEQYAHSVKHVFQFLKMKLYWHPLHMRIFRELAEKNFVCVSKTAKEELEEILHLPAGKSGVDYIYNPVGIKEEPVNYELKENTLVYVGRLSPEKRTMLMLKVWEVLSGDFPSWKFVILGDGPIRGEMERYVSRRQIRGVEFKGYVKDVRKYLLQSKVSILLSKYEGLPTGMLEACACGNALIGGASDGGLRDIVHDGCNGYIVATNDFHGVVSALRRLMQDEALCRVMGLRSVDRFKAFSEEKILEKWRRKLL